MDGKRTIRILRSAALLLALALTAPRPAWAQSWYLDWLKRLEEWSMEEDYRGWIFHGLIAASVTFTADRLIGRADYGAALAGGFYVGKEVREAGMWDGFTTDRIMDLATPVVAAVAAAYLLRDTPARLEPPRVVPPPPPAPCAPVPAFGHGRAGPRLHPAVPWLCLAASDESPPAVVLAGP